MTSKLASRYAKALFQSGSKDQREGVLKSLDAILVAYAKFPKLRFLLESPELPQSEKENSIKKIFGNYVNPYSLHFLSMLFQKGRFKYLPEIAVHYRHLFTESYGITNAHLTTAIPVDNRIKDMLQEMLEKKYQKKFAVKYEVNPQIVGGGILIIEARMIDFSIKGQLNKLKATLLT